MRHYQQNITSIVSQSPLVSPKSIGRSGYAHGSRTISSSSIANAFFSIGLSIILVEGFFFNAISNLAESPFWVTIVLPVNLFPSEIWFVVVGTTLMLLLKLSGKYRGGKLFKASLLPIIMILLVYSVGAIHGLSNGYERYLQDFRNMCFGIFSLPAILYFFPRANIVSLIQHFSRRAIPFAVVYCFLCVTAKFFCLFSDNETHALSMHWIFAYLLLLALFSNMLKMFISPDRWSKYKAFLFAMAIVLPMNKPVVGMFIIAIVSILIFVLFFLKRFQIKVLFHAVFVSLIILTLVSISVYYINSVSDGSIEGHVRSRYLKEGNPTQDLSGGRFYVWTLSVERWLTSPWFGTGLGDRPIVYSMLDGKPKFNIPTHNIVIQTLFQTGALGLAIVALSWFLWLRRSMQIIRQTTDFRRKTIIASMFLYVVTVLGVSLYGVPTAAPTISQLFWFCVGSVCAMNRPTDIKHSSSSI